MRIIKYQKYIFQFDYLDNRLKIFKFANINLSSYKLSNCSLFIQILTNQYKKILSNIIILRKNFFYIFIENNYYKKLFSSTLKKKNIMLINKNLVQNFKFKSLNIL